MAARDALGPDPAVVPCDNPLHRRQSYPDAREFLFVVESLECTEQFVRVGHVESCAVVADKVDIGLKFLLDRSEF